MPTFNQSYLQSGILFEQNCSGEVTFSLLHIPDVTAVTWNFGDPASGAANISDTGVHTYAIAGTYTVTAQITSNGAIQTATTKVVISPALYSQPQNLSACAYASGKAVFNLEAQSAVILAGLDASQYTIHYFTSEADAQNDTNAIENAEIFISEGETIFVSVINNSTTNCKSILKFEIIVMPLPVVPDDLRIEGCSPFNLTLAVANMGETFSFSYYKNVDDANTALNVIPSPEAYVQQETGSPVYVRVQNSDGCTSVGSIEIIPGNCEIQKGISPNGDDKNDIFDLSNFEVDELSIYNRYGVEVYSRVNYTQEWHGQSDSKDELPTGTYYYFIKLGTGNSKTGWVYINREIN
jgi:gliding motility-associated-like protein